MDATYHKKLILIDSFIAICIKHVKGNPESRKRLWNTATQINTGLRIYFIIIIFNNGNYTNNNAFIDEVVVFSLTFRR